MSGTTQTALIVAGIGLVGTAAAVPVVNAWLQRRNARRAAHEPAVGAARLIKREMEQIHSEAQRAFEADRVTSFSSSEWDQHKVAVASRLSQEELLVLDRFYATVKAGAVTAILALYSTASQAISWLARGESNAIKPRKTEISLAPANMDLPCRCGHIFGHHGWRAVRRRVRLRRRHAKFKDVGFECKRCDCRRFRGVGRLQYV